jgi:hypothetical protein
MSEKRVLSVKVSDELGQSIDKLQRDRDWDRSKALREMLADGLEQNGYPTDGNGVTRGRRLVRLVALALFCVGATLVVLSFVSSAAFLGGGGGVLLAALSVTVAERTILPRMEPSLTNAIPKVQVIRHGR